MNQTRILKPKISPKKKKKRVPKIDPVAIEAKTNLDSQDPEFLNNLIKLYEREKQSRCCFQLERDKLTKILQIEREKSEALKNSVHEANMKLYDFEQYHLKQIGDLNKKLKYVVYDKTREVVDLHLELESKAEEYIHDGLNDRRSYLVGLRDRLNELNEESINYDDLLKNLMLKNANKIDEINTEHTKMLVDLQKACQARFVSEQQSLLLMNRNTAHEMAEVKNEQIAKIRELMKKGFDDMKSYFTTLTTSLMSTVKKLGEENRLYERRFKEMTAELKKGELSLKQINEENERLTTNSKVLTTQSNLYVTNKRIFQVKDVQFKNLTKKIADFDLKYEALFQAHGNLRTENERLNKYIKYLLDKFSEKIETLNIISLKKIQTETVKI